MRPLPFILSASISISVSVFISVSASASASTSPLPLPSLGVDQTDESIATFQICHCTYLTMTWPTNKYTTGAKVRPMFGNFVPRSAGGTHFCDCVVMTLGVHEEYRRIGPNVLNAKDFPQRTRVREMTLGQLGHRDGGGRPVFRCGRWRKAIKRFCCGPRFFPSTALSSRLSTSPAPPFASPAGCATP
ncbi:hypothetical protein ANTQUA_LOCUS3527 [Anthophora quadrimaculata]